MYDLIVSSMILLLLFGFLVNQYNYGVKSFSEELNYNELKEIAVNTSNSLILSKGFPSNWVKDINKVKELGLVKEKRILSKEKINALAEMDYSKIKELLNLFENELFIELIDFNGTTIKEIGLKPVKEKQKVSVRRVVIYEDKKTKLVVTVWK